MRIAILRGSMDNFGGIERLSVTLAKYLNADLISTSIDETIIKDMGFSGIRTKSIGRIPTWGPFRRCAEIYKFRRLNVSKDYDYFIMVGSGALSAIINNRPALWYVDSPSRRIWDLYEYTKNNTPHFLKWVSAPWIYYNRYLDKKHVRHVNTIIACSENVRKRIKEFLNRDSVVIYPPVDTKRYHHLENGDFWLSVNRIVDYKRLDLQMEVFNKLPRERLIIVGCYEKSMRFGQYIKYIYSKKPGNVEFRKNLPEGELLHLYATCKGLMATAKDEDFGLTPLEAMASGKPVIAVDEGGYRETVVNHVTGELVNADKDELIYAIGKVSKNPEIYKYACRNRANEFDVKIFIEKIKERINAMQHDLPQGKA